MYKNRCHKCSGQVIPEEDTVYLFEDTQATFEGNCLDCGARHEMTFELTEICQDKLIKGRL